MTTPTTSTQSSDNDSAYFTVSSRDADWEWILYGEEGMLAHSLGTYQTLNETFGAIDQLWNALNMELYAGRAGFEITEQDGTWLWRLVTGERGAGTTLAISAIPHQTREQVVEDINEFKLVALDAAIRIEHPPDERPTTDRFDVGRPKHPIRSLKSLFGRGRRHRKVLKQAEIKIAVSGIRGKSSTTKRLDEIFNRRGYDTITKITGDRPTLLRNGEIVPIERHSPRVTLYENVEFFQRLTPTLYEGSTPDVAIVENQAITEYTMRMVNERFFDPDVVIICNVRQDHNDTLGDNRQKIARAFGRSIPSGAHVVNGEQHPVIHEYLREEIEKRGGTISQVDIPEHHQGLISAETVYALNETLSILNKPTISEQQIARFLLNAQPTWSIIDSQRVFNASKTNDIESTEAFRRALVDGDEQILPFVYLRGDRRGRTASFAEYMNILATRDCISRVHVGGDHQQAFANAIDVPCELHPTDADPNEVLEELLAEGLPVIFMGNTVAPFMRQMERVLLTRSTDLAAIDTDLDLASTDPETIVDAAREQLSVSKSENNDVSERLRSLQTDQGMFEVYEDQAGEYRWRFLDHEGTIRADSGEGYRKRSGAITAVGRFRTKAMTINIEQYEDRAGEFRWRARSTNGNIIADGTRGYANRDSVESAVERVRALASDAPVVDIDSTSVIRDEAQHDDQTVRD